MLQKSCDWLKRALPLATHDARLTEWIHNELPKTEALIERLSGP